MALVIAEIDADVIVVRLRILRHAHLCDDGVERADVRFNQLAIRNSQLGVELLGLAAHVEVIPGTWRERQRAQAIDGGEKIIRAGEFADSKSGRNRTRADRLVVLVRRVVSATGLADHLLRAKRKPGFRINV